MPQETPLLAVIFNPAASGGAGRKVFARVEGELRRRRIPYRICRTEGPGHARDLAREAQLQGASRILVVGGDGTVHEVANGILDGAGNPPALAVVPVGTGNDFFRMVGASRSLPRALAALEGGRVRLFDVGRVRFGDDCRYFVNLLGVGVDVEVLRRRAGFRYLKGLPQYLAALGTALVAFRPQTFRISIQGEEGGEVLEDRTLLAAVTVGPSVGGGFLLSPEASPEDGLLDLFFVGTLNVLQILRFVPRVVRGTHQTIPQIRLRRFREARFERPGGEEFFFELDGELVDRPVRRLDVEVLPARLPVLVPGGAP